MEDNFINEDDEQLIKTLLKNKPTFNEDLIDFYLSYHGCKVNEKSSLRLISLVLHKSLSNLIDNAISKQSPEKSNNKKESKNLSKEKELNYKELVKTLKNFDENYENEEILNNFNVFLE